MLTVVLTDCHPRALEEISPGIEPPSSLLLHSNLLLRIAHFFLTDPPIYHILPKETKKIFKKLNM